MRGAEPVLDASGVASHHWHNSGGSFHETVCLRVLSLSAASVIAVLQSGVALSQEAASTGGIEEVTVTAQRRSEALSRVPISVSAFTAERMETLNVKNFSDIVRFTPGVTFDSSSDNISIRGVNSSAGDATTGIYIDDTPIQLRTLGFGSDNTLPSVFDLQRVEVLRGPQGTLFGAGSEGGTVRYITPQPSLTEYSAFGRAEVSFTQDGAPSYEGGAAVGGPLVEDKLGFRVSAWYRRDGGYIDHINYLTGQTFNKNDNFTNTLVLRAAVAWQPAPELTITPSVFYQNRRVNNDDEYWVGLSNPSSGRYINATPERMGNHDHFTLPALKVDWTPGSVELVSNTSYFDRHQVVHDYSGTLYNLSYFQQSESTGVIPIDYETPCNGGLCANGSAAASSAHHHQSAGLRVLQIERLRHQHAEELHPGSAPAIGGSGGAPRLGGGCVLHASGPAQHRGNQRSAARRADAVPVGRSDGRLMLRPTRGRSAAGCLVRGPAAQRRRLHQSYTGHEWQLAAFANATFAVTPELKVQVGARYARTHFDFTNFSDGAQNFGSLTGNSGKQDEHPFTPMAGVTYQINDDDMVYFTYSKGYRIGGANPPFPASACSELDVAPSAYNSDTVTSYEAGSKDRFFGGRVQVAGSVYYLKWKNIQQSNYLPSCGFQYTTNLGSAESKGFDLEGQILVTDDLDIDFSLGYTDAHYTSTSVAGGLLLARTGDKLPGSPWTFSVGAQYSTQVMGRDSFLRLDYQFASRETGHTPGRDPFVDPVYGNLVPYDPATVPEPETNLVSARAGMTFDRAVVTVFADNLFNTHPRLNYGHQDSDTLLFEAETLRPRTIGISATYRY